MALAACAGGERDSLPTSTSIASFEALSADAFAPLARVGLELPATARQWLAGEIDDATYGDKLRLARQDAAETLAAVMGLPAHDAKPFYQASAMLYFQHVEVHIASIRHDHPEQVALLARRLRELGDRIFDRGHAIVDPDFFVDTDQVDIELPEEVPDWVAEGMAVGPPLEPAPRPPAETPPLRAETRPTQPESEWLQAVEEAGAPERLDLAGDLGAAARAYVDAAERLRDEPDPDTPDGRERSAVLRLGWLIKADAARAQQLGLPSVALALAGIDLPD